jgi:hypothetical protein
MHIDESTLKVATNRKLSGDRTLSPNKHDGVADFSKSTSQSEVENNGAPFYPV